jgi:hypothetical protein
MRMSRIIATALFTILLCASGLPGTVAAAPLC